MKSKKPFEIKPAVFKDPVIQNFNLSLRKTQDELAEMQELFSNMVNEIVNLKSAVGNIKIENRNMKKQISNIENQILKNEKPNSKNPISKNQFPKIKNVK